MEDDLVDEKEEKDEDEEEEDGEQTLPEAKIWNTSPDWEGHGGTGSRSSRAKGSCGIPECYCWHPTTVTHT